MALGALIVNMVDGTITRQEIRFPPGQSRQPPIDSMSFLDPLDWMIPPQVSEKLQRKSLLFRNLKYWSTMDQQGQKPLQHGAFTIPEK